MVVKVSAAHRRANIRSNWRTKIGFGVCKFCMRLCWYDCAKCDVCAKCERYLNRSWFAE